VWLPILVLTGFNIISEFNADHSLSDQVVNKNRSTNKQYIANGLPSLATQPGIRTYQNQL
jgi:hypothetical protein